MYKISIIILIIKLNTIKRETGSKTEENSFNVNSLDITLKNKNNETEILNKRNDKNKKEEILINIDINDNDMRLDSNKNSEKN